MANKARKYHSTESLAESTTTATTNQTKATLTFTPDASSTYVYMWSCDVKGSSVSYDVRVSLLNGATTLGATNWETADITADYVSLSGIAFETFGASPISQSITLVYSSENVALTSTIRNARIVAIKLNSSDAYVENTADQTTTSVSLQTATTLTFTPATTSDYLIIGSCEYRTAGSTVSVNSQITYNSTGYSVASARTNDVTNYISGLMQASVGSLTATSKSVTLQWSSGTAGTTVYCRRARLLALRLDEFTDFNISTDSTRSTTQNTTYVDKLSTNVTMTKNLNYLIVGTASIDNNSTAISAGFNLAVGGTSISETFQEASSAGFLSQARIGAFSVYSAGTASVSAQYDVETNTATAGIDDVTLSVLLLDPTELYWVGGSGTWNSSTTANWSLTSGGSGSAAAPKAGTNVFFNSASDSSAPFTVTINAGAVCGDLTASGLDQTMTWSGSGAMSVYGIFSVPATNFTQSYTGTITFAATTSETITTNGKSFTAFTFDGVGGSWTLQDAATVTGAATLTNGTLALGSYTLTCDTFASNNSNVRTINFGTGKIAITSSSTATVWNTGTVTNLTVSGTPLVELTGGGATTKTVTLGALTEANSISVTLNTTAGTVALTGSVRNLIIGNNTFTLSNSARTIYGNLTINGTNPTLTAGTGVLTFGATSGTQTITTNGKTLDFPITFNGAGGTFQLGDDLTVGTSTSRAVVLTNGTLELNGKNINLYGTFALSQGVYSPDRQLLNTPGGTNAIILSIVASSSTQVWNSNDLRSYYTDGKVNVKITGAGLYYPGRTADGSTYANTSVNWQISSTSGDVFMGDSSNGMTVRNFTIDNNTVNITLYSAIFTGSYTVAGTNPIITYSGTIWTWIATTGIQTINLNGNNSNVLDLAITINGAGGTLQLQHNLNVGTSTSRAVTLTNGSLDLNGYTLTIFGSFVSSNSNTRTIAFGATGKIVMSTTAATSTTVTSLGTSTNLTVTGTDPLLQFTGSGVGPLNIVGVSSYISLQLSPAAAATIAITQEVKDLRIDNSSNITLTNSTRSIYGSLTIAGTNPTINAGTFTTTFAATSGTQTITTNGKTLDFPITFDGVGGTWQLQDALSVGTATSRTVTLTNGTLDLNNLTFTLYGAFSTNNSNARTLAFGTTGKMVMTLAGNLTTNMWNGSNHTNLTVTGTSLVEVTGSGTLTRTFGLGSTNSAGETNSINFSFLTSAGTVTLTSGGEFKNLTINGSGTTFNVNAQTIYGNYTWIAGTISNPPSLTMAATSGTKTITTGGITHDATTINGVGGTFELADDITHNANQPFTFINGTFDAKTFNVTASSMQSDYTNTRTLNMGSGTWTLSDGGGARASAQPWNINDGGTGLTLNKGTANIVLSYNGAGAAEFYGGNKSYNNVTFSGSGTGLCRIYGSNTFGTVSIPNNRGKDLYLEAGSTNTFAGFDISGENGDLMLLQTTSSAGVQATIAYSGTTKQTVTYALVKDIIGYPAQTWYFTNSTDSGNNKDVYFYAAEPYFNAGNGPPTWLQFL